MIVVTTNDVPGYRIDAVLGEVMGLTVRSANIGQNFVAGFRAIGGGEVKEYTQLVYASREEVMARMVQQAQQRGANAVIAMRFDTGDIAQAFSEVCAYGTAVVVSPIGEGETGATKQSEEQARNPSPAPQPQPAPPGPARAAAAVRPADAARRGLRRPAVPAAAGAARLRAAAVRPAAGVPAGLRSTPALETLRTDRSGPSYIPRNTS